MRRKRNYLGLKSEQLTVIAQEYEHGIAIALATCTCGGVWRGRADEIASKVRKSCGCLRKAGLVLGWGSNRRDITGERFGKLVVLSMAWVDGLGIAIAQCDCGGRWEGHARRLLRHHTQSCGCLRSLSTHHRKDLTDQRFGRLVVTETSWNKKQSFVRALCDCGRTYEGRGATLLSGDVRSCGCLAEEYIASLIVTGDIKKTRARETRQRREAREQAMPRHFYRVHRQFMLDYWNRCCCICGVEDGAFWYYIAGDHWVPVSSPHFPGHLPTNIVPLCHKRRGAPKGTPSCNNRKYNFEPVVWLTEKLGPRKAKAKLKEIEAYFVAAQAYAASLGKEEVCVTP